MIRRQMMSPGKPNTNHNDHNPAHHYRSASSMTNSAPSPANAISSRSLRRILALAALALIAYTVYSHRGSAGDDPTRLSHDSNVRIQNITPMCHIATKAKPARYRPHLPIKNTLRFPTPPLCRSSGHSSSFAIHHTKFWSFGQASRIRM
jgi:hypothetical protein